MKHLRTFSSLLLILFFWVNSFCLGNSHSFRANDLRKGSSFLEQCGSSRRTSFSRVAKVSRNKSTSLAYDLLQSKCAKCHHPNSSLGTSFSDILDVDQLLSRGIVKAGDASQSLLIEVVEDGRMPAGGPALTEAEKQILRDWVNEGAQNFTEIDKPNKFEFISNDDFEACIAKDFNTVELGDRHFVRYFTLGHLYNANKFEDLNKAKLALNKLLNSLSWETQIINAKPVDPFGTLFRIDIRNYRWTEEMWNEITQSNPFASIESSPHLSVLKDQTLTETPILRADWFIFQASRPPLYHSLLYDRADIPVRVGVTNAERRLEYLLSVDALQCDKDGTVTAAGFRQSNVTKSNRIIRRYDTPYGAYWKSDDFKTRIGDQNILEHPVDAKRDGGEFIFSLPNGLHGYLITNKDGKRLDGAPTEVVVDPLRFHKDGVVLTGVSCMSCHTRGIKKHNDEVLPFFEQFEASLKKNSFSGEFERLIAQVRTAYKPNKVLNDIYKQDEESYLKAIQLTGNSVEASDPVHHAVSQFEAPLDIKTMAAEVGVEPKYLEQLLATHYDLRVSLGLANQSTSDRDAFIDSFRALQIALSNTSLPDQTPGSLLSDPGFDRHFEFAFVPAGKFLMGSSPSDRFRNANETQHWVTLTQSFEIQTTEVSKSLWNKIDRDHKKFINNDSDSPVTEVSWNDIQDFINRLNEHPEIKYSKYTYRLPTEAEWEYAARGGNVPGSRMEDPYFFGIDSQLYPSGGFQGDLRDYAWFARSSNFKIHPVGDPTKFLNPLNLHDIYGNVWEWVEDVYQSDLGALPVINPKITRSAETSQIYGPNRVIRGGDFDSSGSELRSANRSSQSSSTQSNSLGFRLVRTLKRFRPEF